jgi:hypothetical protein
LRCIESSSSRFDALSRCGFGPKLYGSFPEGRIEGFLSGSALPVHHLSEEAITRQIACKLGQLHLVRDIDIPKIPRHFERIQDWLIEALEVKFNQETQMNKFNLLEVSECFWLSSKYLRFS